ncbi:MAG: RecB family exonuclease [Smithella sp.]
MEPHVIPLMPLKKINRISPSRYFALKSCTLHEIWAANKDITHLLPVAPASRLGIVVHKILEEAGRAIIVDEETMNESWEKNLKLIEHEMSILWFERHLVPLSMNVRNYEVKRQQCFMAVRKLISYKSKFFETYKTDKEWETEVWVESADKEIGGWLDSIRLNSDGVQIIDYKTGSLFNFPNNKDTIKTGYQQQLKLYAALYNNSWGIWPSRLTILGLDLKEYDIEFSQEECKALLQEAKMSLESVNEKLDKGYSQQEFAMPSGTSCFTCKYRPGCIMYWFKRQENNEWPNDCLAVIKEMNILGNGLLRIILQNVKNDFVIRGLSPERHVVLTNNPGEIIICNLSPDSAPDYFIGNNFTTIYRSK